MKAIVALLSFLFASGAQAQSLKEKYELSERCGKQAAETFAKEWGAEVRYGVSETNTSRTRTSFESHYNSRLNKCLYLEFRITTEKQDLLRTSEQLKLIDLLENRDIGVLQQQIATTGGPMEEKVELCLVQGKDCKTEEEWRALIKPFMED